MIYGARAFELDQLRSVASFIKTRPGDIYLFFDGRKIKAYKGVKKTESEMDKLVSDHESIFIGKYNKEISTEELFESVIERLKELNNI